MSAEEAVTAADKPAVNGREAKRVDRIERRRRQVLNAAAQLMQETGYHAMSMQAVAERADISVGLIYQYFGGKEDVLQAVIVDILEDFRDQVPARVEAAGDDPVARLASGIRAFCEIIDAKRDATTLTYRESKTLTAEGKRMIKDLEIQTTEPIRRAIQDGIASGVFRDVDPEIVVHNVLMGAHGWALKHWHLAPRMTLESYITRQSDLILASILDPVAGKEAAMRTRQTASRRPRARSARTS
jgi:AcrR family transcriptional regulator